MKKQDFTYDLPEEKIATAPLDQRDASKLLLYQNGTIQDRQFTDLPQLLPPSSQLIFNNTRVVKARIHFVKTAGAKPIEVFCLGPHKQSVEEAMNAKGFVVFECLVGNLKRWKDHSLQKDLPSGAHLEVKKLGRSGDFFAIQFEWSGDITFSQLLEEAGKIPLPPYMNREAHQDDVARYQTVYAETNGSVAAPTAGLHFTPQVLEELEQAGHERLLVTLHVGAGTFKPLGGGAIDDHEMHSEEMVISKDWLKQYVQHSGPKFAVGTTSLRTLESCYWMGVKLLTGGSLEPLGQFDAYSLPVNFSAGAAFGALIDFLDATALPAIALPTQLMIKPGYSIKTVSGIITNFHQPGSTLLLLVHAFVGEQWKAIYNHALENNYRFLSYGDSSLLYL